MRVLAGDIGGTKTRLAVFDVENGRLDTLCEESYSSGEYASLDAIVRDFLDRSGSACRQALQNGSLVYIVMQIGIIWSEFGPGFLSLVRIR